MNNGHQPLKLSATAASRRSPADFRKNLPKRFKKMLRSRRQRR